jgi:elongation factor G
MPSALGVEVYVVARLSDEQLELLTREQIDFVKSGILNSIQRSGQTPFQFGGVSVVITSIYFHSVDANDGAFFNAGGLALARAVRKMRSILIEPTMRVEIVTPDDYMGPVVGEVNSRRGKITRLLAKSGRQVIEVEVPLSSMFGFATTLRSLTKGRASHTMQFLEYKQLPANIAAEFLPRK